MVTPEFVVYGMAGQNCAKPEILALAAFLNTCKVIEELVRAVEGLSQKQRGIA